MDLSVSPKPVQPNQTVRLTFEVRDPWKNNPVTKFEMVHERLFHTFIVSRDLEFFLHDHPAWENGSFHYDVAFPKPGMYRVLGDFYPEGASPQLIADTLFVAGADASSASLTRDYSAKTAENMKIELSTSPAEPVAGTTTQLRVVVTPDNGLQKYLGVWGHMLAASDDLIDLIHTHPLLADGASHVQFSLVFPRHRMYRVWLQFQRNGVINTAHFDIPVSAPTAATANNH